MTAVEDQVKQKNEMIQTLAKLNMTQVAHNIHLGKQLSKCEANQQHISDELKSLVHRLDNVSTCQDKDGNRNTNEFRKLANRLEHLNFRQFEYENGVQANANGFQKIERARRNSSARSWKKT